MDEDDFHTAVLNSASFQLFFRFKTCTLWALFNRLVTHCSSATIGLVKLISGLWPQTLMCEVIPNVSPCQCLSIGLATLSIRGNLPLPNRRQKLDWKRRISAYICKYIVHAFVSLTLLVSYWIFIDSDQPTAVTAVPEGLTNQQNCDTHFYLPGSFNFILFQRLLSPKWYSGVSDEHWNRPLAETEWRFHGLWFAPMRPTFAVDWAA